MVFGNLGKNGSFHHSLLMLSARAPNEMVKSGRLEIDQALEEIVVHKI
jgi:hypothetical protein